MKRILLIGQADSSSGFLRYTIGALREKGCEVIVLDAHAFKGPKIWPTLKCFSFNKDRWYQRRWESNLYSPTAWDRNTRLNGRMLDRIRRPGDIVLHMAKEHYPHPQYTEMPYYIFIQTCLAVELDGGVSPWLPRPEDRADFMEREGRLFNQARKVFTGANYVQDYLRKDYGVSADRLALGGGGADSFFIDQMPAAVPAVPRMNMIMVGWDYGMKGGPTAVEALQIARKSIPNLTLTLVGPPADQVPDAPGLIRVGPLRDRARLLDYYRQADVFILPTLYDSFGFVFCEAMSQGLPCIGSDFNAVPELITQGVTGYLAPRNDPQAWADRILEFYRDPANRLRMGQAAMQKVREEYTWGHVADRLLEGMTETL